MNKTQNQAAHTPTPWWVYNETCVAFGDKFVAQTILDDDYLDGMSPAELASEQHRAEADADLIVRAVNEHAALLAVAEAVKDFLDDGEKTDNFLRSALVKLAAVQGK